MIATVHEIIAISLSPNVLVGWLLDASFVVVEWISMLVLVGELFVEREPVDSITNEDSVADSLPFCITPILISSSPINPDEWPRKIILNQEMNTFF